MAKKIKITKKIKEERLAKMRDRWQKKQLAIIEAKYQVKVDKTFKLYYDKTWGELWDALDVLKEQMRKELKEIGIE